MFSTATIQTDSHFKEQARSLPLAESLADLSEELLPIMEKYGLAMSFGPLNPRGVCIADATCNPTNAYKARGTLASAFAVQNQGAQTVWTASAGNHGAGLAYAAERLGLNALIYVPTTAPQTKVDKITAFGAAEVRTGSDFDSCLALAHASQRSTESASVFVHLFDEHTVVAGQGTIGFEIIRHVATLASTRDFDTVRVFVPIGGGGLGRRDSECT